MSPNPTSSDPALSVTSEEISQLIEYNLRIAVRDLEGAMRPDRPPVSVLDASLDISTLGRVPLLRHAMQMLERAEHLERVRLTQDVQVVLQRSQTK